MRDSMNYRTGLLAIWGVIGTITMSGLSVASTVDLRFYGLCDVSAAETLGDDTVIVASDEENTLFSYSTSGGLPIAERDINGLINLVEGSDEIDIEAAAKGGDRIWWIGSHQAFKPNRRVIFATNIPDPDLRNLRIIVQPQSLADVLRAAPDSANLWHATTWLERPKNGGMNIEAAAVDSDNRLLIGLRAPLDGPQGLSGAAIVVAIPLDDPWRVSEVYHLDLGDRGLRAMVQDGAGFIVVAGPVDGGMPRDLYHWHPGQSPEPIEGDTIRGALDQINPEAIVGLPQGMLVFSDDGTSHRMSDAGAMARCKDLARLGEEAHNDSVYATGQLIEW